MQTISALDDFPHTQEAESTSWIALDTPDEWSAFSEPRNDGVDLESSFLVTGMHCAACALSVEKALKTVPGVISAEVSASGRASVLWSQATALPSQLAEAVRNAGYRLAPALDTTHDEQRRKETRLGLWRWVVAGFCMMQVMMYAFPGYVAKPGEMTADMAGLLRWASWMLTLPVVFFSCGPFFSGALQGLRQLRISMDLPVALGILITFVVSSAATFDPQGIFGHEAYFDSLTMFVFFLLTGRRLESNLRKRTAGALEALMRRLPEMTDRRESDGTFTRISTRRLQIGDILRVLPGEAFPADGTITNGVTKVNEALLTGESRPLHKISGAKVIAGSYNLSQPVEIIVDQLGKSTIYGQIVALMQRASVDKPRIALLADRIARPFLLVVMLAALGAALFWWHLDPSRALMAAVAVLIVTCPCALSLATPAAMLATSGKLAKSGVLVRRLQGLEALAGIDTVLFDKTGTLTNDSMRVAHVSVRHGMHKKQVWRLAASLASHSLHPASRALVSSCPEQADIEFTDIHEQPGQGLTARLAGGVLRLGSVALCGAHPSSDKLQVHLADDSGWLASFELEENIRDDALAAVHALQATGIKVEILSGDRATAVSHTGKALGIADIHAEATPQDKLLYVQHLHSLGRKVLMVGDGLNDGPVLASADVSIALGKALPLARAQSDFVILSGQISLIPALLIHSRLTMRIVRQNLLWAAGYNALCIPLAVIGWLPAWLAGLGMAASSLLVVMNSARLLKAAKER